VTDRDRAIVTLAFGNLEKSISSLPTKTVRGPYHPPLTRSEVAALRRRLTVRPSV
jgi:hypothetical protein